MDGFTLWVPLPEVPKGVMDGKFSRRPTAEQQEAKYFRHAMDIRRLFPQMKYVRLQMMEEERRLDNWEDRIKEGLPGDKQPGPINEARLAVMCAQAQLESNRSVQKSLKLRYEQLLFVFTEYVQKLQKERAEIALELCFKEDDPKELTKEMVDSSLHYERIYRALREQNQTKFIYSMLEFPTPASRNDHILKMEVECDDHVYLGCIQHIKKLLELQDSEKKKREISANSGSLMDVGVSDKKQANKEDKKDHRTEDKNSYQFLQSLKFDTVSVDDPMICSLFYKEPQVTSELQQN